MGLLHTSSQSHRSCNTCEVRVLPQCTYLVQSLGRLYHHLLFFSLIHPLVIRNFCPLVRECQISYFFFFMQLLSFLYTLCCSHHNQYVTFTRTRTVLSYVIQHIINFSSFFSWVCDSTEQNTIYYTQHDTTTFLIEIPFLKHNALICPILLPQNTH